MAGQLTSHRVTVDTYSFVRTVKLVIRWPTYRQPAKQGHQQETCFCSGELPLSMAVSDCVTQMSSCRRRHIYLGSFLALHEGLQGRVL